MKILKRGFKLGILSVMMALALLLGVQSTSHATLVLTLNDHAGHTAQVADGNNDGLVSFNGALGAWNVNVSTALVPPALGGYNALMDLNSVNNTSQSGGTLTIVANQTGYGPGGTINFQGSVGGTLPAGGSATFSWYAGGQLLGTDSFTGPGAFSGSGSATKGMPTPYDVTLQADITHTAPGATSFNQNITVPEPTTLILLGLGLASLGILGRRKFKKN